MPSACPRKKRKPPKRLDAIAVLYQAAAPCEYSLAMRAWIVGAHAEYRYGPVGKGVRLVITHDAGDEKTRARAERAAARLKRHGYRTVTVEAIPDGPRQHHPPAEGEGPPPPPARAGGPK